MRRNLVSQPIACGVARPAIVLAAVLAGALALTRAGGARADDWRLRLMDVRVQDIRESSGDRPYFAVLSFRSRFGGQRQTEVRLHLREPHDWVSKRQYNPAVARGRNHMRRFDRLPLPWWMANVTWRDIPQPVPQGPDAARATFFGAVVIAIDNNNTPPHLIRRLMFKLQNALRRELVRLIERQRLLRGINALNPAALRRQLPGRIRELSTRLGRAIKFGTSDAIDFVVGSTHNPDRIVGIQVFVFPTIQGLDQRFGSTLTIHKQRVMLRGWMRTPAPSSRLHRFRGSGASYVSQVVLTRLRSFDSGSGGGGGSGGAGPGGRPATTLIRSLHFRVKTGHDDLRRGSRLIARVGTTDSRGNTRFFQVMRIQPPNGIRSRGSFEIRLPFRAGRVPLSRINRLRLEFIPGGKRLPSDGDDQWDLTELTVTAIGVNRRRYPMLLWRDFARFNKNRPRRDFTLRPRTVHHR